MVRDPFPACLENTPTPQGTSQRLQAQISFKLNEMQAPLGVPFVTKEVLAA